MYQFLKIVALNSYIDEFCFGFCRKIDNLAFL